jgi:hypothetical protein
MFTRKTSFVLLLIFFLMGLSFWSPARKYPRYAYTIIKNTVKHSVAPANDSLVLAQRQQEYLALRDSIEQQRKKLSQKYTTASAEASREQVLEEARKLLITALPERMYPYWYGTEWDFNGITETPGQGQIACGYLVSTTLRHAGFVLNRYKLAQQHSFGIVKTLSEKVHTYHGFKKMYEALQNMPDDIYIIGLDNHVGILVKSASGISFVHSTYVTPSIVVSEPADASLVLGASNIYVLGNLTANKKILKAWLTGQRIQIAT